MSEKLLDILKPRGDCLPEELLIRYADGKLPANEARRVEEHISECEFCSDALDGIMQGENRQHFHSQLSSIKKIVYKKVRSSEAPATFPITRRLAVAATLLLLAISAWYVQYIVNDNEQKVFSNQFEPYPVPKAENDTQQSIPTVQQRKIEKQPSKSISDKANPHSSLEKGDKKKETEQILEAPPASQKAAEHSSSLTVNDNTDVAPQADRTALKVAADSTVTLSKSANYATVPDQGVSRSQSKAAQSQDEIMKTEATGSYSEVIIDHLKNAMSYYQSNRYAEAIAEFERVLKQEPNNADANFYSGVSFLALKNPDEALKYFRKTDNKNNQYYEATLWYEALSYLNKSDKKEAKNLFEKVVKLNGEYRMKAEETLKQL